MKRILAILLCTAMALTLLAGCQGEQKDPQPTGTATPSPAPEVTASPAPAADQVVARVGDAEILYGQLAEQMVTLEAMYSGLSEQFTPEELQEKLHAAALSVLENLISEQILRMKIEEYGLSLTDEEQATADAAWDNTLAKLRTSVAASYPDLKDEDLEAMVQLALESSGLKQETVVASAVQSALVGKLKEQVTAPVSATETEVGQAYQELLTQQQKTFAEDATAFEAAMIAGDPVVFVPETYRVIQEIYLRFDDDVIQLLTQLKTYDTEDNDTYEDMLKQEYKRLRENALPQLRERLSGGAGFAQLMEEIKPGSSTVFNYVGAGTTRLAEDYYETAMSISAPGQVSEGTVTQEYGYKVLYWADTLEPGVRPLEQVYDAIEAELSQTARSQLWTETQKQWRQEADVEIYEDRLGY